MHFLRLPLFECAMVNVYKVLPRIYLLRVIVSQFKENYLLIGIKFSLCFCINERYFTKQVHMHAINNTHRENTN